MGNTLWATCRAEGWSHSSPCPLILLPPPSVPQEKLKRALPLDLLHLFEGGIEGKRSAQAGPSSRQPVHEEEESINIVPIVTSSAKACRRSWNLMQGQQEA